MFYTFGHSNYSIGDIKNILDYYGIDIIVDVRRFPTSKFEYFRRENMEENFKERYMWMGDELGGSRDETYENYMNSEEFREGIKKLIEIEKNKRIGIMCSEKLWFRCHRRYIADYLSLLGYPVSHIINFEDRVHPKFRFEKIGDDFFKKDAKKVAINLLGKIIVKKIGRKIIAGKIVETEAYYGDKDPASRAFKGRKNYNRGMWKSGGHIFIYMVHANWMFNITTDGDEAQAVLIRAVEPLIGIHLMRKRRNKKIRELCNGPGKWTRTFEITQFFNEVKLGKDLFIASSPWKNFEIKTSKRIGVREDLDENLRFFIAENRFVSRGNKKGKTI